MGAASMAKKTVHRVKKQLHAMVGQFRCHAPFHHCPAAAGPGQPEIRDYIVQYREANQSVARQSDPCRMTVQRLGARARTSQAFAGAGQKMCSANSTAVMLNQATKMFSPDPRDISVN